MPSGFGAYSYLTWEASISEIASAGTVNRRNVYDALKNLQDDNLVIEVRGQGRLLYRPADPRKLMHIVQKQRQRAASVLPSLEQVYRAHIPEEQAFISKGVEGIRNFWQYVVSQDGPAYFVGGKGSWHDPRLESARQQYFSEAKEKGVRLGGIFDFEMRTHPEIYNSYDPQSIRFFAEDYSTNAGYDVCGERVMLFPMVGERDVANVTIYNIISQPLADSFRTWFKYLWQNAQSLPSMPPSSKPSKDSDSRPAKQNSIPPQ